MRSALAITILAALVACGDNLPSLTGASDASSDAETPRDAPGDTVLDALPDAMLDAPNDAMLDASPDAMTDASPDAPDDVTPPATPTVSGTTPTSPSRTETMPTVFGSAEASSTVRLYADSLCTSTVLAMGTATNGSFAIAISIAPNSYVDIFATATDAAGNTSGCGGYASYMHDDTPPDPPTLDVTYPASPANHNRPIVSGWANLAETVALYSDSTCSTRIAVGLTTWSDDGYFLPITVADNSTTTVYATATDAAGNTSACSTDSITYVENSALSIAGGVLDCQRLLGGNAGADRARNVATNTDGSIIVAGTYGAGIAFGLGEPNQTILGGRGMYIVKYAVDCSVVWAVQAADGDATSSGVAVDGNGVYVTGSYATSTFGPGSTNETALAASALGMFLAHVDVNGDFQWVVHADPIASTTNGTVGGNDLAISPTDGSITVTGTARGMIDFDGTIVATSGSGEAAFVVRYRSNGTQRWVAQAGDGNGNGAQGSAIAALPNGDVVTTGRLFGSVMFPPVTVSSSGNGGYIARYRANGTLEWAKQQGGGGQFSGADIAVTSNGAALLVTGSFGQLSLSATFGPGEPGAVTLSSIRESDGFLAKFATADGSVQWARRIVAGFANDGGVALALDSLDRPTVTGSFGGLDGATARIGEVVSLASYITGRDFFVARFDAAGTLVWVTHIATPDDFDGVPDIAISMNRPIVVGWFLTTLFVSPGLPGSVQWDTLGLADGFMAVFNP